MAPRKDVLGLHSFSEECVGIGLKTYDCNFFMMTYHMNCMLVCNTGEMMKICIGYTWLLGRMYGVYIASQRDIFGIGLKTYDCNHFYDDISYKLRAYM